MRQRRHHVAVGAPHRLRGQHRVDDGLLGRLHRRLVHRSRSGPRAASAPALTPFSPGVPVRAVEKAMKRSPDPAPAMPPMRPMPSAARRATRRSWCGRSGASVATTTMIEPWSFALRVAGVGQRSAAGPNRGRVPRSTRVGSVISCPTGTPGDPEQPPLAEVALHQHADGEPAGPVGQLPARGADAALEAEADHPGAAADVPLGHRSGRWRSPARGTTCSLVTWKP